MNTQKESHKHHHHHRTKRSSSSSISNRKRKRRKEEEESEEVKMHSHSLEKNQTKERRRDIPSTREKKKSKSSLKESNDDRHRHTERKKHKIRRELDDHDDRRHYKSSSKSHHRDRKKKKETRNPKKPEKQSSQDEISKHKNMSYHLFPLGEIRSTPLLEEELLDPDRDYFTYHTHLRLYLFRNKGIYFEDLSSTEAREAFQAFCSVYNDGVFEEVYYQAHKKGHGGFPIEALLQCKRTRHEWKFNTNEAEKKVLDVIKDGVRKQTEYEK